MSRAYWSDSCWICCCCATICWLRRSICCVGTESSLGWVCFRGAGAFLRMLSSDSLLFARNSGCLNSHACDLCETSNLTFNNWGGGMPTFCPYGDWPFSSLFCRTLWKSYLFSWRTKLAKLLCLKCFGRMVLVNFSHYRDFELAEHKETKSVSHKSTGALPPIPQRNPLHHPSVRSTHRLGPPAF